MPFKDKEKNREYQRQWKAKNRTHNWEKKKANMLSEFKDTHCAFCKETFPDCCYDIHHVNPEEKLYDISFLKRHKSIDVLKEELEKCIVLCAHCHRKHHAGLI